MTAFSRLLTFTLLTLLVLMLVGNVLRWNLREVPEDHSPPSENTVTSAKVREMRVTVDQGLVLLSGLAVGVGVVLVFVASRRSARLGETRAPFAARDREMRSLSLLAATSARAQEEISVERGEREKAEADSQQRLRMLNQALEEKIRMGRDLHDGVIQSLYAAGLNLESARRVAGEEPGKAREMVDKGLQLINRTIAEIRAYIGGLSPRAVRGESFAGAMAEVVEDLRAGRPLEAEWNIADEAVAALNDAQVAESLQILREAVSNALRHGGADHLRIRLQQTEQGTELSVRDNGAGFTPRSGSANGYGLANMEARAQSAAGVLELTSTPGSGTCVQILWQTAPSL